MAILVLKLFRAAVVVLWAAVALSIVFAIARAMPGDPWRYQASVIFGKLVLTGIFVTALYSIVRICLWSWVGPSADEAARLDLKRLRMDMSMGSMVGLVLGSSIVFSVVSPSMLIAQRGQFLASLQDRVPQMYDKDVRELLKADNEFERRIARLELVQRGINGDDVAFLVGLMLDDTLPPTARWEAARLVCDHKELCGNPVRSDIAAGLTHADPLVQRHACFVLGELFLDAPGKPEMDWESPGAMAIPATHEADVARYRAWWARKTGAMP